jgi:NADPH:quinone reductase-like Zn-dependent oxidoreductase
MTDNETGTPPDTAYRSIMPKIVRFNEVGGPEVLKLEDLPAPRPKKGEARIKVEAIGLNRAEVMFRRAAFSTRDIAVMRRR